MLSETSLRRIIEHLREQLVEVASAKNDLLDDEVLQLSQLLDYYILKVQYAMSAKTQGECRKVKTTA
ncbi:aspartyl-phosphate phosphatase Spo0E family protein [Paenibacillus sp. TRM 82003]|nr:aspartyl-phosphate phosphatase Spo0E family protein [Paenibacillus sp. TRM 82003]